MVSHSSHTNHLFLTLVIWVINVSFAIESFVTYEKGLIMMLLFFFYQGFLTRILATHRTAGGGRGPSFIPLFHFHPLTNIQIFICNFACEITYFQSHRLHLPACYSMRCTTLSNNPLIDYMTLSFVFYLMIWF